MAVMRIYTINIGREDDEWKKMLTDHKGDKGATWISLKNKNGKEIYFAEYVLGWGLL